MKMIEIVKNILMKMNMKLCKINKCIYNNLIYLCEFIDKKIFCSELYFYLIFG